MRSRNEIAEELYSINAAISLFYVGMRQTPKPEAMLELNKRLGQIIKD